MPPIANTRLPKKLSLLSAARPPDAIGSTRDRSGQGQKGSWVRLYVDNE